MLPLVPPPLPGEIDLWDLHLVHDGRRISCRELRSFLYYLASRNTHAVAIEPIETGRNRVEFRLFGPKCDDGKRMYLYYTATRANCALLTEREKALFSSRLDTLTGIGIKEKLGSYSPSTACTTLNLPVPAGRKGFNRRK